MHALALGRELRAQADARFVDEEQFALRVRLRIPHHAQECADAQRVIGAPIEQQRVAGLRCVEHVLDRIVAVALHAEAARLGML